MVLGLIIAGTVGLAGIIGGSKVILDKQETEREKIQAQLRAEELEVERQKLENERQQKLTEISREKIASITPGIGDDIILFLQKNAIPITLIVVGTILFVFVMRRK